MPDKQSGSLDPRSCESLRIIVEEHIRTGEPVSSRRVSRLHSEKLSAATIRNLMAELTERGFLAQPHTSAGRVPSDRGYRYFVDEVLTRRQRISQREVRRIEDALLSSHQMDHMLAHAGRMIGELTGQVGIVLSPDVEQAILEHADFVRVSARRVVAIFVSRSGMVIHRVIDLEEDLSQAQLDRIASHLKDHFLGLSLPEVHRRIIDALRHDREWLEKFGRPVLATLMRLFEGAIPEHGSELILEGTSHLLQMPEFRDLARLRVVLETLEERTRLLKLLDDCLRSQGVKVIIGSEADDPGLAPISVVASPYRAGRKMRGLVGVVGPRRMAYARAVALVDHFARTLSRVLADTDAERTRRGDEDS
ncbi:MAG: heat-inducible transcription repressor HrcA [Acidobacteriota bacterium]|nr:MAG: heat-inducible transcription repressor HrcA [Acidobacteriota bacterium]